VGIINRKEELITDRKLKVGDGILLLRSNGINGNGLSLARALAKKLPKGYSTKLSNGKSFGESILTKTNIYAKLVQELLDSRVDIHYISNITGHGLRKIMRARQPFSYVIERIFKPQEVFSFIQESANLPDVEMYQTFNMGADFALFLPEKDINKARAIVKRNGFSSIRAGYVEKGERQVIIKPKKLIFKSETLDLR
jgi:phosphoribosylformylglycinamidine cyclo-ligase